MAESRGEDFTITR